MLEMPQPLKYEKEKVLNNVELAIRHNKENSRKRMIKPEPGSHLLPPEQSKAAPALIQWFLHGNPMRTAKRGRSFHTVRHGKALKRLIT